MDKKWLPTEQELDNVKSKLWSDFDLDAIDKALTKFTAKKIAERLNEILNTCLPNKQLAIKEIEDSVTELLQEIEES